MSFYIIFILSEILKAAILHSLNSKWEIQEIQTPKPSTNQVLIKINASGLCYTDIHFTRGELPDPNPPQNGRLHIKSRQWGKRKGNKTHSKVIPYKIFTGSAVRKELDGKDE